MLKFTVQKNNTHKIKPTKMQHERKLLHRAIIKSGKTNVGKTKGWLII